MTQQNQRHEESGLADFAMLLTLISAAWLGGVCGMVTKLHTNALAVITICRQRKATLGCEVTTAEQHSAYRL